MRTIACLAVTLLCFNCCSFGQSDSSIEKVIQFPNRLFGKINKQSATLDNALTRQTGKYLRKLARQEKKIHDHLYKIDSNAAKNLFNGAEGKYVALQNGVGKTASQTETNLTGEYVPYIDSLKSSLDFANKNPQLLNASPKMEQEISASLAQFNRLQNNFKNADQVKEYIRQRKEEMKNQLQQYIQNSGIKKELDKYSQSVYYYSQQVREYKEALSDPDKLLEKALIVLNKFPAFTDFIKQNGQLAGLFGVNSNYGTAEAVVGMQTRDQVQQIMQSSISAGGAGGLAAVQSNLESAHQQLDQYKDKLAALGSGSGDIDMPGFKPNNQKTKRFLKKLELGMNIQTTKADGYFPSTTDLGLSVGIKATNKITYGIGVSYNMGWGTNITHIHFTSQGMSLRTFIDMQLIKSFFISGGLEANYTTAFTRFSQLQTITMWQRSGLIGLSKMISLPGKMIKKTKVSLLWDFLSYYQIPHPQAFIFRVGYNFK